MFQQKKVMLRKGKGESLRLRTFTLCFSPFSYFFLLLPLPGNLPLEHRTPVEGYHVPPPAPSTATPPGRGQASDEKAKWVSRGTGMGREC